MAKINKKYYFLKNQKEETNIFNNKLMKNILPKRFNFINKEEKYLKDDLEQKNLDINKNNYDLVNDNINKRDNKNPFIIEKTEEYKMDDNKNSKLNLNTLNKEIGLEISLFKIKHACFSFLFFIIFMYCSLNVFFHFYSLEQINYIDPSLLNINYIVAIIIASISLFFIIYNVIILSNYISYGKIYLNNEKKALSNNNLVPEFLKSIFIKRIKNRYYTILLTAIVYTTSLLLFPILYSLQSHVGKEFAFAWWTIGKMPDISNVIIIIWIIFGFSSFLFIANILLNENRKKTIEKFSIIPIINNEEKEEIIKKTKKMCLIIYISYVSFILIFLLIFFIFKFFRGRFRKR